MFVAVSVYVREPAVFGVTLSDPERVLVAKLRLLPEMLTEEAFVMLQERVAEEPWVMLAGEAEKEEMAGDEVGTGETTRAALEVLVPNPFVADRA